MTCLDGDAGCGMFAGGLASAPVPSPACRLCTSCCRISRYDGPVICKTSMIWPAHEVSSTHSRLCLDKCPNTICRYTLLMSSVGVRLSFLFQSRHLLAYTSESGSDDRPRLPLAVGLMALSSPWLLLPAGSVQQHAAAGGACSPRTAEHAAAG